MRHASRLLLACGFERAASGSLKAARSRAQVARQRRIVRAQDLAFKKEELPRELWVRCSHARATGGLAWAR
jgi:hypothetical protein